MATFTVGPGIKMIAGMLWTTAVLFSGWTAHAKYGLSNELFVLKLDNTAVHSIREEKQRGITELKEKKVKFNEKQVTDCGNSSMRDALGLQPGKGD